VSQVIEVDETTITLEQLVPPIVTVAPETKLVPLIVTAVPPVSKPEDGEIPENVGVKIIPSDPTLISVQPGPPGNEL
jgi:hypothetical protein